MIGSISHAFLLHLSIGNQQSEPCLELTLLTLLRGPLLWGAAGLQHRQGSPRSSLCQRQASLGFVSKLVLRTHNMLIKGHFTDINLSQMLMFNKACMHVRMAALFCLILTQTMTRDLIPKNTCWEKLISHSVSLEFF